MKNTLCNDSLHTCTIIISYLVYFKLANIAEASQLRFVTVSMTLVAQFDPKFSTSVAAGGEDSSC